MKKRVKLNVFVMDEGVECFIGSYKRKIAPKAGSFIKRRVKQHTFVTNTRRPRLILSFNKVLLLQVDTIKGNVLFCTIMNRDELLTLFTAKE